MITVSAPIAPQAAAWVALQMARIARTSRPLINRWITEPL